MPPAKEQEGGRRDAATTEAHLGKSGAEFADSNGRLLLLSSLPTITFLPPSFVSIARIVGC